MFDRLTLRTVERDWTVAVEAAEIADPRPRVHDMRHTHASGLIAAGSDVVEIVSRVGDSIETVLRVYTHEFDVKRRSAQRRESLEDRYGGMATEMATYTPSQTITPGRRQARIHRVS